MKTTKWMTVPLATAMAGTILCGTSCSTDWGKVDPPAGIQTVPKLENVAIYDFEEEFLDPFIFKASANTENQVPAIVEDDVKGRVLELSDGRVEIKNPLNSVTCEKAASLTFWMKQIPEVIVAEDGTETTAPQDLEGSLFAFINENRTEKLSFSANGWLRYEAADGTWDDNNPAQYTTGYIAAGEWNYVALTVREKGYDLFVNGERKVSKNVDNFDCSRMVDFMNNVATFSIGAENNHSRWMIDDLKIYRNELTAKETARPSLPGENQGTGGFDFSTFEYRMGDAIYNIGTPDCSAGWWTTFSNDFRIPADTNMRLSFTNHTSGAGNWNNWNLCLATDADRGGDGYGEYFVIRSDIFGWGDASYDAANWTSSGYDDWDQFRADMEGANVVIDIIRTGDHITVNATATCPNGKKYTESYHQTCGDGTQVVRAFLIVDGSYLEIDGDNCFAYWSAPVNTFIVGQPDNSSAWWLDFSDYFTIPANLNLHLGFINYTSGAGNWNNWNLCCATDADRGADGYAEYFVVRSDIFGWGDASYDAAHWTSSGYDDWDQFRADMAGADVDIRIVRENEKITYTSNATSVGGKVYTESYWANCGDGTQTVRAFLICDGSHFEMNPDQCFTYKSVF